MGNIKEIYSRTNRAWEHWYGNFKTFFSNRVPILGHVVYCTRDNHYKALADLSVYLIWSTMPFWLGALVLVLKSPPGGDKWSEYFVHFVSTLEKGELLVLSTALLAPAFTAALIDRPGEHKPFPGKLSHATLVAVVMVICAAMFATQRGGAIQDNDLLFKLSVIAAFFSLLLFYLATLYGHNLGPDATTKIRTDETEFVDDYERHRAGQ